MNLTREEALLSLVASVAVTINQYAFPFSKPEMMAGEMSELTFLV
jgi:hypothetical protein